MVELAAGLIVLAVVLSFIQALFPRRRRRKWWQ